jgi:multiple antibiotic resistance protein
MMTPMLEKVLLSFIPVFVALDAISVLPILASLTQGVTGRERNRIILESVITATCLTVGFMLLGRIVFKILGVELGDFMIAGGSILFCIAISDIINPTRQRRAPGEDFGVVPLGTPLMAGPALLTTSILMVEQHGLPATLVSVITNILLAGLIFRFSSMLTRVLGDAGAKALSKISSLFLAAIAVMLVRRGIAEIIHLLR